MFTSTVVIVQCYCDVCVDYCGFSNSRYSAMVLRCVGVYCGYSNSRYSAMVPCCVGVYCGFNKSIYSAKELCCVWILLWLQQQ